MSDRSDDEVAVGGGHTPFGKCLYDLLWVLCRTLGVAVFGFRSRFVEPLPKTGPLIVLSSHQTFLDPLLLGLATDRRLSSLARSSLYRFKPFGSRRRADRPLVIGDQGDEGGDRAAQAGGGGDDLSRGIADRRRPARRVQERLRPDREAGRGTHRAGRDRGRV
jgi:1-acyl-sn-glycerol-3-phosphate acyltransferase